MVFGFLAVEKRAHFSRYPRGLTSEPGWL